MATNSQLVTNQINRQTTSTVEPPMSNTLASRLSFKRKRHSLSPQAGSAPTVQTPKPTRSFHVAWYPPHEQTSTNEPTATLLAEFTRCTSTDSFAISTSCSTSSYVGVLDNDSQTSRTSSPDGTLDSKASQSQSGDHEETSAILKDSEGSQPDAQSARPPQKRRWVQGIRNASSTKDPLARDRYLNIAVMSTDVWTDDEMLDLTRQFVWGASEPGRPNINDHFATLADTLRDAFARLRPHERLGERFLWHLKVSSMITFEQCWDDDNYKAIGSIDTFPRKGLSRQVSCALSHCKFLGSLYRKGFLDRTDIAHCAGILLKFTTTLEHLTALNNLLFHAGTQLWRDCVERRTEINSLKESIVKAAEGIIYDRALFLHALPLKTTTATVARIVSYLDEYLEYFDLSHVPQYIAIEP